MSSADKLSFVAVGISIFAAIFTWYSFIKTDEMAKNGFNRNYRPYICAANFASINPSDNQYYPVMNTLMIKNYNAPAFVTKEILSFYSRDTNKKDTLLYNQPISTNKIYYPIDNFQITIGAEPSKINEQIATNILPNRLIRKYIVEYEWISDSSLKYFFESEWEYNVQKKDWDIIYQKAN